MKAATFTRMYRLFEIHSGVSVWVRQTNKPDDIMRFAKKPVGGVTKKIESSVRW